MRVSMVPFCNLVFLKLEDIFRQERKHWCVYDPFKFYNHKQITYFGESKLAYLRFFLAVS